MRMLVSVEFADAGTMTGTHRVLVVGGCGDTTAPGDIGISLEEGKTLLSALQWQHVAAQAAEITATARGCALCGARLQIKDWSRRSVHTLFGRVLVQAPRRVGHDTKEPTALMTDGAESLLRLKKLLPVPTRRRRAGRRISTSTVEGTVNRLID